MRHGERVRAVEFDGVLRGHDEERRGQRMQHAFALLSCRLLGDLWEYLAAGERKVQVWYARHRLVTADFSARAEVFANVNSPEERTAVERRLLGLSGPSG